MRFVQEGRRFPLLMTSANAIAGELYRKCGAYQIDQMDHTMLGIRRPAAGGGMGVSPNAQCVGGAFPLPGYLIRRRIGRSAAEGELAPLTSAEQATTSPWPRPMDAMAVIRDAGYIRWRYFGRERGKDVFRFRVPEAEDRLVVVRLTRSGYRRQIRVLDVLDLWPPADPRIAAPLVSNLAMRYKGLFDVMWMRSQSPETEQMLSQIGFVRHAFPAPLGWCIDRDGKLPTRRWYLMPGESE